LEALAATPEIWSDNQKAQALMKEKANLERVVQGWGRQRDQLEDAQVLIELAEEEGDSDSLVEAETLLTKIDGRLKKLEVERLLGDEGADADAIVYINAGAGGTEAQDWAAMLLRMYLMWTESTDFKAKIIDALPGEEAGYKSVTIAISGQYAYGFLKGEGGVHRLVRISPFDASARRHTSFASIAVYPDVEDTIRIDIPDKELRIDVYRSSGAGGQSVNTTDSAVRITHLPSGLVVSCQNERSQLKNKQHAMKILKARLYERELEQQREDREKGQDKREIGFGNQIRSYVLQPYQMVKDHRTNIEIGNAQGVLDGKVMPFMEEYLAYQAGLVNSAGASTNKS